MGSEEVREGSFSVKGKVAIVIGAAKGIGKSIAMLFAQLGGKVMLADYDYKELKVLRDELKDQGAQIDLYKVDIRSASEVRELGNKCLSEFGKIDAVYITPGINVRKKLLDYSDEEVDKVFDLNLKGNLIAMRELAKLMAQNGGNGSIIVMSSIRSLVVEPGQAVYSATKAGIVQLVKGLASEIGNSNIRVNAIAPGVVDTPLTAPIKNDTEWYEAYKNKTALKRWATVEEIAGPGIFLAMDAASYIDGTVLFIDGGWTAIDGRFEPRL
jgi:NAD(P)-dependent dehydrogenase (short-subunit alcohol dehydrogenase family)